MFEMQVRCVWVILNNQVRVNFSTNCKFRHVYLLFSDHQIPPKSCPKVQEMAFQRLQISKFPGGACPLTPLEISRLCPSIFAPMPLGNQSQKSPVYIALVLAENFRVSEIVLSLMLINLLLQTVSALLTLYKSLMTYSNNGVIQQLNFFFSLFVIDY